VPAAPDYAPSLAASGRRRPPQTATQKNSRRVFFSNPSGRTLAERHSARRTAPGYRGSRYKTASGRPKWLFRDPLGEFAGINLYGYVLNDPVNGLDPFGLCGNGSGGGGGGGDYWDRYINHIDQYSITLPKSVVAALIGGGVMPKTWVRRTGFRPAPFGSPNPLTSVGRGLFGIDAAGSAAARFGIAGIAISGAAIGSYNFGVLVSGLVYAIPCP
jgi:RHS repeat-associated protein